MQQHSYTAIWWLHSKLMRIVTRILCCTVSNFQPQVIQKAHFQHVRTARYQSFSYNFILLCVGSFCAGVYCHLLISILCYHILVFSCLSLSLSPIGDTGSERSSRQKAGVYRPNPQISPFVLQLEGITVIRLMKVPNKDSMRGISRV